MKSVIYKCNCIMVITTAHSEHTTLSSVQHKTFLSLSCLLQILSLTLYLVSVTLCVLPRFSSLWRLKWTWQYEATHTRQNFTAIYFCQTQISHSTSSGPARVLSVTVSSSASPPCQPTRCSDPGSSWAKLLFTQGAGVNSVPSLSIPLCVDAGHTETASTGNRDRISQRL